MEATTIRVCVLLIAILVNIAVAFVTGRLYLRMKKQNLKGDLRSSRNWTGLWSLLSLLGAISYTFELIKEI